MFFLSGYVLTPGFAQSMPEDLTGASNADQVDITGGLADRTASYASQCAGFQPAYPQLPSTNQMASPQYGTQGLPYGSCQSGSMNQGQALPMQPISGQVSANQWSGQPQQAQSVPQQSLLSGLGVSPQQVIGVVGAAALLNYMANGGVQNVLGGLRVPLGGTKFHTYGSCIGGNISPRGF